VSGYAVYGYGFNGDFHFCEPWAVEKSLVQAKRVALEAMHSREKHTLADGTPTLQWMEIFGDEFEESLGLEVDKTSGELVWTGC
jgi:hypothetical protein